MKSILPIIIGLFIVIASSCSLIGQKEDIQNPELSKEIVEMRDHEQKLRGKWANMVKKGKQDTPKFIKTTEELIAADTKNTARMKAIVEEYGWPTMSLIGKRPASSAWLLVQHADRDPLFQMHCLPLLKAAMDEGEAKPINLSLIHI